MPASKKKTNSSATLLENSKKQFLSIKAELFCRYYLFGVKDDFRLGNAVRAYGKAYELDITIPKKYSIAGAKSSGLLKNGKILERMKELLNEAGFNDEIVDSRLLSVITQGNDSDSVRAIKEYNALKGRVKSKMEPEDAANFLSFINKVNAAGSKK